MEFFRRFFGSKDHREDHPSPAPAACPDQEAVRELREAEQHLGQTMDQRRQAEEVAGRLHRINQENHFARDMLSALRGIVQQ
jgi:hypothetical protein